MNIFAHNGHDHIKEITHASISNQTLLVTGFAVALLAAVVGLALFLKRKK